MSSTVRSGVEVVSIATPALGDRSYLAHDGELALVVDPQLCPSRGAFLSRGAGGRRMRSRE
jgi:hydroxyacylglutathione hydrolase